MAATEKDVAQREAMRAVERALGSLNDALRGAMALKIRVEIGTVDRGGRTYDNDAKTAKGWSELWTKDGLAVRFTREEIATAPEPAPPVVDAAPQVP